jgi:hypothetical protein
MHASERRRSLPIENLHCTVHLRVVAKQSAKACAGHRTRGPAPSAKREKKGQGIEAQRRKNLVVGRAHTHAAALSDTTKHTNDRRQASSPFARKGRRPLTLNAHGRTRIYRSLLLKKKELANCRQESNAGSGQVFSLSVYGQLSGGPTIF